MILFIAPILAWLYDHAADIASGVGDFLRSIPSYFAPKPSGLGSSFTPPYSGGQCAVQYSFQLKCSAEIDGVETVYIDSFYAGGLKGALGSVGMELSPDSVEPLKTYKFFVTYDNGTKKFIPTSFSRYSVQSQPQNAKIILSNINRIDGLPDNCGNLNNPISPPPIADDGLFKPNNPTITNESNLVNPAAIVLAPALPLVLVTALAAGYAAAVGAAKAASDALEAVKKIAEALEALKSLWDKLKEFLDEWEKNRPKKRDIVRQTYGQIIGDGALDFFSSNNQKAQAIQLDIVITSIPSGISKYYGSLSPSRYRYKELGYIAFYSVNQGILETHSIQFKRTTLQIPELAVGFIYHLGLDEAIRGYAFATFSIEKE